LEEYLGTLACRFFVPFVLSQNMEPKSSSPLAPSAPPMSLSETEHPVGFNKARRFLVAVD